MRASIRILGASFIAEYEYRPAVVNCDHLGSDIAEFDVELTLLRFAGGSLTPWLKVSKWLRPLIESEIAATQFDLIEADYAERGGTDPESARTKWVDGVEYEWEHGDGWYATGNSAPGLTNTPRRGESFGSRS